MRDHAGGRAAATLKRELQAAKDSYQYRLRELQDRNREQALRKIAKELVRQRVEAQQLSLFEEFQQEAEMGVQELEEQVAVLRQDVERTRQLLTRERDNRINDHPAQTVLRCGKSGSCP